MVHRFHNVTFSSLEFTVLLLLSWMRHAPIAEPKLTAYYALQTPKYLRRAGKLVRVSTPAPAVLEPAMGVLTFSAAKGTTGAKAAAAARLLKQAQMRRQPARVYRRQSLAQASLRQPALCPAFCR